MSDPSPQPHSTRHSGLLWMDGLGCYRLLFADEIVLGGHDPSRPETATDVLLMANLSRKHITLGRTPNGYYVVPHRPLRIDGRTAEATTVLRGDELLELGTDVQIRFRKPSPLSLTARLDVISGHRGVRHLDGLVWMEETCVIGSRPDSHIVVEDWMARDWERQLILFRRGDYLQFRTDAESTPQPVTPDRTERIGGCHFRWEAEVPA